MSLTHEQRSAINKANAARSTGPKTKAGKEASRQNAMKHGMTAEVLRLPNETTEDIQAHLTAWNDALEPANYQEDQLVFQASAASLRLKRMARAESAVLSVQMAEADCQWIRADQIKLLDSVRMIQTDPGRAVIELRSFGSGVSWLIQQWTQLRAAIEKNGHLGSLELIKYTLRLRGFDPENLRTERSEASEFAILAISTMPNLEQDPRMTAYMNTQMHPLYLARTGGGVYPADAARAALMKIIDGELAQLGAMVDFFEPAMEQSRNAAGDRAMILQDTAETKLLMRYAKAAESALDRAVKTLAKLQADRKKAKTKEKVEEIDDWPVVRNEPNSELETPVYAESILDLIDTKEPIMSFAVGKPPQTAVA